MKNCVLAIIVAITMALGTGTGALAQTESPAVAEIEGNITTVDTAANIVTITSDNGTAVTLNVTDRTEIEALGKESATLDDLEVGQRVKAKYETSTMNALEIEVEEVEATKIEGEITALDSANKTITITPKQGAAVTLTIIDKTEIEVWGKEPAGFQDLKLGDWVKAEYNPITKEALEIEVRAKGEPSLAARQGFFGTVNATTNTSLTLTTKQGVVTFTVDNNTQFWKPPQKGATLADIKVGDRAAVLAVKQDSILLAKRVLVIPSKPVRTQVTGTVSKVEGNTITLIDKDGNTFNIELPKGLATKVQVGDVLTLTLLRTPGVEKYIAQGLLRGDELRERLNGFLERIRTRKADTGEEIQKRAKDLEELEGLLQRNMERHQEMLQKVLDKASPEAKQALEKAREVSRYGWEQVKEAVENEREEGKSTGPQTPPRKGRP